MLKIWLADIGSITKILFWSSQSRIIWWQKNPCGWNLSHLSCLAKSFHKIVRVGIGLPIALVIFLICVIWWICLKGNKMNVCNVDSGLLLNYMSCSKIYFFAVSETNCFTGQSAFPQFFYHLFILQHDSVFPISFSVHLCLFNHICPYIFSFILKE